MSAFLKTSVSDAGVVVTVRRDLVFFTADTTPTE